MVCFWEFGMLTYSVINIFSCHSLLLYLKCIKDLVISYCDKIYQNSGITCFWSIKNSTEVLDQFKTINHDISTIDSYDFSTLYTTLPHELIKQKLGSLITRSFNSAVILFKYFSVIKNILITVPGLARA